MADTPAIQIKQIDAETILVPIIGTSPLIVHNWSEKAKRQMLDKMQGRKSPKEIRDPQADYEACLYRIHREGSHDAYGFPVIAFKAATVGAARFYDKSVSMTSLRQLLFFRGEMTKADRQELVEINGEPEIREDMVRVGMTTDLRYRPMFTEWSATLRVTYVANGIDRASVLSLIDAGGMGVGVGEWRPEKSGSFGTFAVDQSRSVEVVS